MMESETAWIDSNFPRHHILWNAISPDVPTDDLSHDADHLRRVYRWSLRLAPEAGADLDLAGAAALVHDLVAVPKEAAERPRAGELSAASARSVLERIGYQPGQVDQVCAAVSTSNWSRGSSPPGPLGQVLQDADRLDAIGAIGIARTIACAQTMVSRGKPLRLYHPLDALARRRSPDETHFALDHFHTKLLRLAEGMHLPGARAEAHRRHARMVAFLESLAEEIGEIPETERR